MEHPESNEEEALERLVAAALALNPPDLPPDPRPVPRLSSDQQPPERDICVTMVKAYG